MAVEHVRELREWIWWLAGGFFAVLAAIFGILNRNVREVREERRTGDAAVHHAMDRVWQELTRIKGDVKTLLATMEHHERRLQKAEETNEKAVRMEGRIEMLSQRIENGLRDLTTALREVTTRLDRQANHRSTGRDA